MVNKQISDDIQIAKPVLIREDVCWLAPEPPAALRGGQQEAREVYMRKKPQQNFSQPNPNTFFRASKCPILYSQVDPN
jgi:hypothetical protein